MALISCPECTKQVSDKASSCPDCGYPIHQSLISGQTVLPTTTIEQTDKKWKKAKLVAAGLVFSGIVVTASGSSIGVWLLFAGIVSAVYAGLGSWWHHS